MKIVRKQMLISPEVRMYLAHKKADLQLKSYDAVIRYLIKVEKEGTK